MLLSHVNPDDLSQAGWGVIFAQEENADIRDALRPLLDLRMEQAGDLYRELSYLASESLYQFRERYSIGPGSVNPKKIPFYILLVGSPERIPFRFQSQLSTQHAVGRLAFERSADYASYVRAVLAAESLGPQPKRAVFAAVRNEGDNPTNLVSRRLVQPLVSDLKPRFPDWSIEFHTDRQVSKPNLLQLLDHPETPRLLFVSAHGYLFSPGHERQRDYQGAIVCQDWPGPQSMEPVQESHVLTADDLDSDCQISGSLIFLLACNSVGTPQLGDLPDGGSLDNRPEPRAPRPFVSRLAQRLLSLEKGGALAVVGHVDHVLTFSDGWMQGDDENQTFRDLFERILRGHRVGYAMLPMSQLYLALAAELTEVLEAIRAGDEIPDASVAHLWKAQRDARNYLVLGDPAIRLATRLSSDRE